MDGYQQSVSLDLYKYLSNTMVGSEQLVKTARLLMTISDEALSKNRYAFITSGSKGEGIIMPGSDLDLMIVLKYIHIVESGQDISLYNRSTFIAETDDVTPGFVRMRLVKSTNLALSKCCQIFKQGLYLSNGLFKQQFMGDYVPTKIHGPCISDEQDTTDMAFCLWGKFWIKKATSWIIRPNRGWPSANVKARAVKHGTLFVPVGSKGSKSEEFEWRTSFSVTEKFLIYSFNHTQLICYLLMKALLKNVLNKSPGCDELLCSYFIKTMLFWVFEETKPDIFSPKDLIPCFIICLKRLIYCVEYSTCPHYFIPENNLFENKFEPCKQALLLQCLMKLYKLDWRYGIYLWPAGSHLGLNYNNDITLLIAYIRTIQVQDIVDIDLMQNGIKDIIFRTQHTTKRLHLFLLCLTYGDLARGNLSTTLYRNKDIYFETRACQCLLLQSTYSNPVQGWMLLATLFYNMKQYTKASILLEFALSKYTNDMINLASGKSSRQLSDLPRLSSSGLISTIRYKYAGHINLTVSPLTPLEIIEDIRPFGITRVSPIVYGHFVSFLCHYHLHDLTHVLQSLTHLRRVIEERYFVEDDGYAAIGLFLLGVSLELVGDIETARDAYQTSISLLPNEIINPSFQRLSRLNFYRIM